MNSIFNYALPQGEAGEAAGQSQLGQAAAYDSSIVNGNRASITQAMAPEINSITGQANQNRKQQAAMGTNRGGGTNQANQQASTNTAAQVSDLIAKARPQAAQQLSDIGGKELANAGNLLGLGQTAGSNLGELAGSSRQESDANNAAAGEAAGELATALLLA